jgi:hypothetical protein
MENVESKHRPSWPGGVAAPKAQTGWWFKIHEEDSQSAGQKNAPAKTTSQRDTGGEKSLAQHGVGPYVVDFYCPEHKFTTMY